MTETHTLYGAPGAGSMIAEAALAFAGVPTEFVDLAWEEVGWHRTNSRLVRLNPLGQVPTLVMPDGSVMTESAAIVLHLGDAAPGAGLVPPADHPERRGFFRWLVFLVSAVYPTFTYGDVPKRWLDGDEAAAKTLRSATDEHRNRLWRYLEQEITGPWMLGQTWSALDVYLWPMTYWRPGREWFALNCPKLHAIAAAMDANPVCAAVWARNGLDKGSTGS